MADASRSPGAVISGTDLQKFATTLQMLFDGKDPAKFGYVIKGEESPNESTLNLAVYEIEGLTGTPRLVAEKTFSIGYHRGPFLAE